MVHMTREIKTRIQLAGFWISLMLLYVYADLFSFYRPGYVSKVIDGQMGILTVNQSTLLISSVLMLLPIVMIPLSLSLQKKLVYILNCIVGILYTFVNISNLLGEYWLYYLVYGVIEIAITVLIVLTAFRELRNKSVV